jgi:hypothetical protein
MAKLVDSKSGQLDAAITTPTNDMDNVLATKTTAGDLKLSAYLTGLDDNGCVKTGCTYAFDIDGTVHQTTPSP